ncbi:hypothetical protein Poly24_10570 [Rosistilla carotiformis]|uniref:Outer membrane efflux protein n=1 Tax=Rosistilla carotiformis TaxID=2528017 RepID=A0A518JP90_9BACT|nr:hypothetical protein [Rosistilla carotiformis]QDV67362.1 hypothetical protein Poly24_10570 [Rosistilla carotiformis]
MATVCRPIVLIQMLVVLAVAGATLAWAQGQASPVRSNPLVVSEPDAGSILVDDVPDRQRPIVSPPAARSEPTVTPQRLPPVNDLQTPHAVVPHRLEGEYSIRKQSGADSGINQKPIPAIERTDAQETLPPPPAVEVPAIPSRRNRFAEDVLPPSRQIETPQPQIDEPVEPRQPDPTWDKPRVYSDMLPQVLRSGESNDALSNSAESNAPPMRADPIGKATLTPSSQFGDSSVPLPAKERVIQEPVGDFPLASPVGASLPWSPWWQTQVQTGCHLDDPQKVAVDLDQLITIAMQHSPLLEILRLDGTVPQHGGSDLSCLTLRYSRPSPPGCDPTLNSELVFVARHRTAAFRGDTCAKTADMLLQIADAYWNVYRLRGLVAIGQRHHDAALALYEQSSRQFASEHDRQRFVMVEATIRQRRADVNSKRIALKQAQNELAFLVSVPGWQNEIELMPQDVPCECDLQRNETQELERALVQRAEVRAAIARLESYGPAAQHQLVNSRIPTLPTAGAQASQELEAVMDLVRLDVKDAMLKLRGNFAQMRLEAETAEKVAEELAVIGDGDVAAKLEAQDRLQTAESNYITALTRYNVAILQLRRANGLLFVETPL